jgi:hypothetical protein
MAKLASILKTDVMADFDLKGLAQILQNLGRKGDKILAHITPEEAEMLKEEGGSGTINPNTGLPEYYDGEDFPLAETATAEPTPSYYPDTSAAPAVETTGMYQPAMTGDYIPYSGPAAPAPASAAAGAYDIPSSFAAMRGADQVGFEGAPGGPAISFPTGAEAPKAEKKGILEELGLSTKDALKLGMGGVGALVAGLQGRAAQKRAQEAAAQTAAIGAPYQAAGQAQMAAAQRGELTPERQQTLQAAQAQMAQGIERRGGVGAMQAATQLQTFRNQLLQDQYNYGLKIATLGDQYAANAIKVGLTQDQAVAQAMRGLTGSLGQFAAT